MVPLSALLSGAVESPPALPATGTVMFLPGVLLSEWTRSWRQGAVPVAQFGAGKYYYVISGQLKQH
jgi:hypothetical protein